jgi:hypothetical protein
MTPEKEQLLAELKEKIRALTQGESIDLVALDECLDEFYEAVYFKGFKDATLLDK